MIQDEVEPGERSTIPAIFDEVLWLMKDIFLYKKLISKMKKRYRENLSTHLKFKLGALFAQECQNLPLLKYHSYFTWDATVFGPKPILRYNRHDLCLDEVSRSENFHERIPFKLRDICDPLLFDDVLDVYTTLTPTEIAWLSIHRTAETTRKNVTKDIELWKMHMENIFALRNILTESVGQGYRPLIEREMEQAAKDIKVALKKMKSCNSMRTYLKHKLLKYGHVKAVATRIALTIDNHVDIDPKELLYAEARRTLTTLLRLNLSKLGYGKINHYAQHKEQRYIELLGTLCGQLGLKVTTPMHGLRESIHASNAKDILMYLHRIFDILSGSKTTELGRVCEKLDRWLTFPDIEGQQS